MDTVQEASKKTRSFDSHKKVGLAVVDLDGVLRGKFIHPKKFSSVLENGFGFCSVIFGWDSADQCYADSKYTGWHNGYPDAHCKLDLATERMIIQTWIKH